MRQIELEETGINTFVTSFQEFGRAEGLVEGQAQERRAFVLRLLNHKLGPLVEETQTRIASLSPDLLLTLSEALLDFASVEALAAWLA